MVHSTSPQLLIPLSVRDKRELAKSLRCTSDKKVFRLVIDLLVDSYPASFLSSKEGQKTLGKLLILVTDLKLGFMLLEQITDRAAWIEAFRDIDHGPIGREGAWQSLRFLTAVLKKLPSPSDIDNFALALVTSDLYHGFSREYSAYLQENLMPLCVKKILSFPEATALQLARTASRTFHLHVPEAESLQRKLFARTKSFRATGLRTFIEVFSETDSMDDPIFFTALEQASDRLLVRSFHDSCFALWIKTFRELIKSEEVISQDKIRLNVLLERLERLRPLARGTFRSVGGVD